MIQLTLQEIKDLAEKLWEGCHGCTEDDKQMWINGYITGTLANQIELPSDEDIEKEKHFYFPDVDSVDMGTERFAFKMGAKWMRNKILNK